MILKWTLKGGTFQFSIGERTHGYEKAAAAPGAMTTVKDKVGKGDTGKLLPPICFFYQEVKYLL